MRRVLKKIAVFVLSLALLVSASGCAELTGLDAQSLMSPPKTTADRQAIYALMRSDQSEISLVYPKNGEYRSAIISKDLNGDGRLEVASFCINSDAGGIRLQFFSKGEDGTWFSLAEFMSGANQVDKVFFGDLTGDGNQEIVVGWGDPLTATSSISVYYVGENIVHEFQMGAVTYSEMLITDFDSDGVQELFVLDIAGQPGEDGTVMAPLGHLYRFDGAQPYESLTVPLDAAVVQYSSASFAQLNSWRYGAVLDGIKADGRMITQVVALDQANGRLLSPLSNAPAETPNKTDRTSILAVTARDINSDGVLEIPTAEELFVPENGTADSTGYSVTWNTYSPDDNAFTPVVRSIVNTAENYFIQLPLGMDKIACQNNPVTRTATFFGYSRKDTAGELTGRENLFSVTVYDEAVWEEKDKEASDDVLLGTLANRAYVLRILNPNITEDSELIRSVIMGFKILSE